MDHVKVKFTRQGIRDLSNIKAKPKGKRLEMPVHNECEHKKRDFVFGNIEECANCGTMFNGGHVY